MNSSEIQIFSRVGAENFIPKKNLYVAISIKTPDDLLPNLSENFVDICHLSFYDTVNLMEPFSFKREHASKILDFINQYIHEYNFMIHCDAGISRSAAVAKWIEEKYDANISFIENPPTRPNTLVISTLNEVSGINKSYKEFWEKTNL